MCYPTLIVRIIFFNLLIILGQMAEFHDVNGGAEIEITHVGDVRDRGDQEWEDVPSVWCYSRQRAGFVAPRCCSCKVK